MNGRLYAMLADENRHGDSGRITGAVVGVVTNNKDPDGLGRVKVRFPWLSETDESNWARMVAPMAGNGRGVYFLPEVEDEVLVMFERGDVRFPFVIGALWNGKDVAPASNDDGKNNVRVIRSRSGHVIKLNDEQGKETLEIIDASGANSIVIDTAANTITVTSEQDIVLAAPRGRIELSAKSIAIKASSTARIDVAETLDVVARGNLALKGEHIDLN